MARRRLLSTAVVETPPVRLEPALEKAIRSFESSIKAGRAEPASIKAADKSKSLVDDFVMLQRFRVQKVMLVCSDYDSYTFEEEGCVIATVTRCSVPGQQPASVARVACDGGVPPGCA